MFGLLASIFGGGADVYKNKETGLELPKRIGSFTFDRAEPYQFAEESGESVAYGSKEASSAATIYIRHLAPGMNKTADQLVEDAIAAIKELESRGIYSDVKVFSAAGPDDPTGWKKGAFIAKQKNGLVMSFIYCNVKKDYAFKIRVTSGDPEERKAALFEMFVKDVKERINKLVI